MKKLLLKSLSLLLFGLTVTVPVLSEKNGDLPAHPRDLKFKPLDFTPPQRKDHRQELANGAVAYFVEDHDLPLVNVSVIIRIGQYLDPADKVGLAQAVGSLLRTGGTATWSAEEFDEEADFLAANFSSSIGNLSGNAGVNALSKDLDQALKMFFEMLQKPAFQENRLSLHKSQLLQQMERRNDSTDDIEAREWNRLLRGADHFSSWEPTKSSVESISREDLVAFHKKFYQPDRLIFAVSGDFKTEEMKQKLNQAVESWQNSTESVMAVPRPAFVPVPGVYMVNKSDVNQGRVGIGHLGIELGNPDEFAIDMMNDVLGGSGFTSRITNRVRSDEGLAYSAGSSFTTGAFYPGTFRAGFQSKSESVAQASQIVIDEINRIRNEKVSEEELETVKSSAIEIFPRFFASAGAVAGTFANDEFIGRDQEYWNTYRDNIRAVTTADVERVAQKYVQPDKLVILAVGNVEAMMKGDADKPDFSFNKIAPGGKVTQIPLPDPLTMRYP